MLGRIGFWYVAAIVATVVMAGIGAASTLNNTLVGTGGNVIGVVVGGAPHFFGAFQDGLAGGSGNTSTFSFTRNGQTARPGNPPPQQRQARQQRRGVQAARTAP
jgi:hypothetical protein